jgi:hypothetical protein
MWNYIPSLQQIGVVSVALDTREAMKEFPEEVEAKCCECGSSFRYARGDGFGCPFCGADFHTAHFNQGRKRVDFEGKKFYS